MSDPVLTWIKEQHPWLREAAHRIRSKGALTTEDHAALAKIIKEIPEGSTETANATTKPEEAANPVSLRLISLGPVEGIDALAPRTPLAFGDGNLTIIYGDNGSGKSGYTRILKKTCGKPEAVDLKGNVFAPPPDQRKCRITYKLGDEEKAVDWQANSAPVPALETVDIFDFRSGRLYLDGETEVSYAPRSLALLADLVNACHAVDELLAREQEKLVSKLPSLPTEFQSTPAGRFYNSLSASTREALVEETLKWTQDKADRLTKTSKRLDTKDPASEAKKMQAVKEYRTKLIDALEVAKLSVSSEAFSRFAALKTTADTRRKAATESAKALASSTELDGLGSSTWRALWEAAREYSVREAYPEMEFPKTTDGARCVLCQQELDESGKKRLNEFQKFVQGKLLRDAEKAEKDLEDARKEIPVRPEPAEVLTASQAADLPEDVIVRLEEAWQKVDSILRRIREGDFKEPVPVLGEVVDHVMERLKAVAKDAEKAAQQLLEDAKSLDRPKLTSEQLELQALKWASEQREAVVQEVSRLKQRAVYDGWRRVTSTTGISRKASTLSETLITEAYINRFNTELRALGAERIEVELVKTRASQGRTKHRIRLRNIVDQSARVPDVLSDGECRIVMLAAFLADVTGRDICTPFIFDDPISSLDQRYEEKTIERLVALSSDRQVLVFTHRLSFLSIATDKAGPELTTVCIRRASWGAGEPGEIPMFGKKPEKALNDLKNNRLVRARKELEGDGYETYYPLAKAICSDLRILLERIVEEVLLADVVKRYRRSITTMNRIKNLAKIRSEDCQLIDEFMTNYSCYEHSQSLETPVDVPEPDKLLADIERIINWHSEYVSRN